MADILDAGLTGTGTDPEHERERKLAAFAREVVAVLAKTVAAMRMYLPNNPVYLKFREDLEKKFELFFLEEDMLTLTIGRFDLSFRGIQVYTNTDKEESLAFLLYKDGVRDISFHKGITPDETDKLMNIMKAVGRSYDLDDDVVTLLWEGEFSHVTYTAADDAAEEDKEEEGALFALPDYTGATDGIPLKDVEEIMKSYRSGIGPVVSISDDEAGRIAALERGEDYFRGIRGSYTPPDDLSLLLEVSDIFHEVLLTEKDIDSFGSVADSLSRALEIFVDRGLMAHAAILLAKMNELSERRELEGQRAWKVNEMINRASSDVLITKVGEYIDHGEAEAVEASGAFLRALDRRAVGSMVKMLEKLSSRKARKPVCEIIAGLCGGDGKELLGHLKGGQWYLIRNVAMILGEIKDPSAVNDLGVALRHPDQRVRREVITALAKTGGESACGYVAGRLSDSEQKVRETACRSLVEMNPSRAFTEISEIIGSEEFDDRQLDEKKLFHELLGRAGGGKAVPFLTDRFAKKGIFSTHKKEDQRVCAAYGLAATGTVEAEEILVEGSKSGPTAVREACSHALRRIMRRG